MKSKIIKILVTIIALMFLCSIFSEVLAATLSNSFKGSIDDDMEIAKTSAQKILSSILEIVRLVGAAAAIIILIVIACKYIIASAGDRADIKKYAINYVIGALILFGASGIASMAKSFVDDATSS